MDLIYDLVGRFDAAIGRDPGAATFIVLFAAACLVSVLVHELGHLLAARACGVRARAVVIGGTPWVRIRVRALRIDLSPLASGGRVEFAPRPIPPAVMLVIVAAGPAANLILSVAAIAIPVAPDQALAQLLAYTSMSSFLLLANLVPLRIANGIVSDGELLRQAWQAHRARVHSPPTSIPPPGAPTPKAPPPRPIRPVFVVAFAGVLAFYAAQGLWMLVFGSLFMFCLIYLHEIT